MKKQWKKGIGIAVCTAVCSANMAMTAYCGQAYVNDQLITKTITRDDKIYVPLTEISGLLGANVEYDPETNTAYVTGDKEGEGTVKQANLYPVSVESYDTPTGKELLKTYELVEGQNPSNIPRADFEENGYTYRLAEITKQSLVTEDTKETVETLTLTTSSNNINDIIKELPQEKEFTTVDGYVGTLQLDVNSIKTDVAGYKNYSYTMTETREYPSLATTDTSQIPKTIQKNGKTLTLVKVDWNSANVENVDYLNIPNVYTAVATYSADASGKSVTGYTTTADYTGMVTKTDTKGTIYTARFTGTIVSVSQAKELLQEAKAYEKVLAKAQKAGLTVEEYLTQNGGSVLAAASSFAVFPVIGMLLGVLLAAGFLYFVVYKNVTIYALSNEGEYEKIGKIKLRKKKPIINLGNFNDVIENPNFLILLDQLTAWRMNGINITLHRGDTTFQHTVQAEKGKKYQFEVKF